MAIGIHSVAVCLVFAAMVSGGCSEDRTAGKNDVAGAAGQSDGSGRAVANGGGAGNEPKDGAAAGGSGGLTQAQQAAGHAGTAEPITTGTGGSAGAGGGPCVDVDRDGDCAPTDCDDENAAMGPSQTEICGNGFDDDCNGQVDEDCLGTAGFYVDRDSLGGPCDDANPGTLTEPWCTLAEANERLTAGQTVYLRAGTYEDETIAPTHSGSSDEARIVYTRYADEEVTLSGSVYCVRLQGNSYISVLGLKFLDCERNVYFDGADHNNVGFCSFDNPSGPVTWAGSRIYHGSRYNRIYGSTFSRYGQQSGSDPDWDDDGCILDIGNDYEEDQSDFNLVADCSFFYGGHHILGVYANRNVIRRNTFHNEEWFSCHREEIGGQCGGRDVITNSSSPELNTRNIFEGNRIAYAGVPPDQVSSTGLSLRTQHNVVRFNAFYSCDSAGVTLSADDGNQNDASHNHIYGNVFYRNGYLLFDDWDPRRYGLMLARWVDDAGHNAMTGVAVKNNVFYENDLGAIYYYYVDEQDQAVANNWLEQGDPRFVAAAGDPDPFDFEALDFRLQADSPCIDHGGFLTVATNDGKDSTTLEVDDADYFFDGYGIVEPDRVQLEGQTRTVAISAVDYLARTITLAEPLTWSSGDGVSLPYRG
ncbi:MAG: hypothetical protein JW940_03215, partial [Polyangiaceae bacterium]|nr:hypothetical protein [Polyangiaceae bacterium]